jgi:hypothetical protein
MGVEHRAGPGQGLDDGDYLGRVRQQRQKSLQVPSVFSVNLGQEMLEGRI